jgi:hypothetical protein
LLSSSTREYRGPAAGVIGHAFGEGFRDRSSSTVCETTTVRSPVRAPRVVLDFLSLHNAKGVAGMSDINLHLFLPTTFILFVTAMGGVSRLRCRELDEQTGRRQSAQR